MRQAMPWLIAAVLVLALAVTTGFVAAYLVANGRKAPDAGVLPTPRVTSPRSTLAPGQTPTLGPNETEQPRRTPTPAPVVTPEPSPIIHIVRRGEYLSYIAGLYCTTVAEIIQLNDIEDPDLVSPRTELLIPGGGCPPEASPAA
jgi:LysM repeat protein